MDSKGGKLIGQGNYGCVFNPPLDCFAIKVKDKDKDKDKANIGKVFFKESEFNNELEQTKIIKLFDPKHIFTLPIVNHCKIKKVKSKSCNIDSNSHQIIYPYGGIDLTMINIDNNILYCFLKIIKGISVMHLHKYIHGDIKPANILYNKNKNVLKLIDFGFASKANAVYINESNSFQLMDAKYRYFPPEYFWFFYKTKMGKQPSIKLMMEHFKTLNNYDFDNYNINIEFSLSKFFLIMKSVKMFSHSSWEVIACKADVYALGITLMEILSNSILDKKLLFMVRSVISHMIEPNVLDRWDINQVYMAWKEIMI